MEGLAVSHQHVSPCVLLQSQAIHRKLNRLKLQPIFWNVSTCFVVRFRFFFFNIDLLPVVGFPPYVFYYNEINQWHRLHDAWRLLIPGFQSVYFKSYKTNNLPSISLLAKCWFVLLTGPVTRQKNVEKMLPDTRPPCRRLPGQKPCNFRVKEANLTTELTAEHPFYF